jgi:hypothetical protein
MSRRKILVCLVAVALSLLLLAPAALALWYAVDAEYGGAVTIEIDGDPSSGQVFCVGDTVTITCDLHSYAAMCAGWGNEALTDAGLEVDGPSGPDSDTAGDYDFDDYECAEVETIKTLTIVYTLTTVGTHTVYARSYAEAASWWAGVDVDDFVEDFLTFEVLTACAFGAAKVAASCLCTDDWKNHGEYVSCAAKIVDGYLEAGLIDEECASSIMSDLARSDCGKRSKGDK